MFLNDFSEKYLNTAADKKIVNDMVWSLLSPTIEHTTYRLPHFSDIFYANFYDRLLPQLREWYDDPTSVHQYFTSQNTRLLGSYFEHLLYFMLDHHPDFRIEAFQEQVVTNGTTKGELDFVVYDKVNEQRFHIEAAIKYYLAVDTTIDATTLWYGPNGRDRLDLKFSKLLEKQIPLLAHSPYSTHEVHSKTWIKGGLFVPPGADIPPFADPVLGYWLPYDTFKKIYKEKPFPMALLPKKNWLSGLNVPRYDEPTTLDAVDAVFNQTDAHAVLIRNTIVDQLLFLTVPGTFN